MSEVTINLTDEELKKIAAEVVKQLDTKAIGKEVVENMKSDINHGVMNVIWKWVFAAVLTFLAYGAGKGGLGQ